MILSLKPDIEKRMAKLLRTDSGRAIELMYREWADYMLGICSRYVADMDARQDVLQESFIQIMTKGQTFAYQGKGSLKAWASRIVVNQALMSLRRQNAHHLASIDTEMEQVLGNEPDSTPRWNGLTTDDIIGLLQKMPPGYRAVFNLYAIEGYSHKEIAEMLGIKADSSASQYNRARNMMARLANELLTQKQKGGQI